MPQNIHDICHIAYLTSNKAIVGNLTTMFGRYISSDRAPQDSNSWEVTETHKKLNLTINYSKITKLLEKQFLNVQWVKLPLSNY